MTISSPAAAVAPKKSRRRWYLLGAFLLLVAAVPLCYTFLAGWIRESELEAIYRDIEADDPHWRLTEAADQGPPIPDDQNAAVQLDKVVALLKKKPFNPGPKWDSDAETKARTHPNARLSKEAEQVLRNAFIALDPDTLKEARKLKDLPQGRFPFVLEQNPFAWKMDYIQNSREVIRLLQCDAFLRAQDPKTNEAAESCQALVNAVHALHNHPTLISQLVRMAGQSISISTVERVLAQGVLAEKDLAILQTQLAREEASEPLYHALRGERAVGQQAYVMLRDGKLSLADLLGGMNGSSDLGRRLIGLFPGWILRGYPEYLQLQNEQLRASKLPDTAQAEAFQKLDQKARTNPSMLTRLILPATSKVCEAFQRTQAQLRCAVCAVAAERYRLRLGRWPASAEQLVKESLLKHALTDPYDGQPLRWQRTATGLLIYSIGPDKQDDGGKLNRANPRATGSDPGFELWDQALRQTPALAEEEGPKNP